jgi:23S rRNA G2445 N2-methylase RlmL
MINNEKDDFNHHHDDDKFQTPKENNEHQNNHMIQKEYFATCIPGLSHILAQELISIGAKNVKESGTSGVKFHSQFLLQDGGDEEEDMGMKAIMYVRTAHRIMELITTTNVDDDDDDEDDVGFIHDRDTLYNFIQTSISPNDLQNLLGNGRGGLLTLNISIIMNNQQYIPKELCHSHYTSLTVKNALVDQVRNLRKDGVRPDVDLDDPDAPFMVVMRGVSPPSSRGRGGYRQSERYTNNSQRDDHEKTVNVSLYRILHSGGSSLHRRGYRSSSNAIHKAAMKESLAAGLLLQSGWDKLCFASRYKDSQPAVLIDPMCGSGTFCVEAAMIAADYAPGLMRMKCFDSNSYVDNENEYDDNSNDQENKRNPHYFPPVVRWKDSNRKYWKKLVLEARERASSGTKWMKGTNEHYPEISNCIIMGNELNPSAFELANANSINSGFSEMISLQRGDCCHWEIEGNVIPGRTIIASNPPWGLRLNEDIEESWLSLKSFLQDQCNEAEAWVLSGNKSATRFLRMKKTRSVPIKTAGEDLRWIQYHIFKKKATIE